MSTAIKFKDGEMIECVSKHKNKTFTNGIEILSNQTVEELDFVRDENWWHIETANTDQWGVHYEHGKGFARDFVRYVRATGNDSAILPVFRGMCKHLHDWKKKTVAQGFLEEINKILVEAKRIDIYQ